jgi:nucleotide-binding universal stress UspA family protein
MASAARRATLSVRKGVEMPTIVVGIDGSDGAQEALEFALREAKLRGADLHAVAAWHSTMMAYPGGYVPPIPSTAEWTRMTKKTLDDALDSCNGAKAGVKVARIVREGQAANVLVDESEDADLLVVGSRGLGGFRGLLVGSVSQQCAHHAHCPVAIVPKRAE